MHIILLTSLAATLAACSPEPHSFNLDGTHISEPCNLYEDVSRKFREDLYNISLITYQALARRSDLNYVYSPLSIWLTLAGLAEGADYHTQQQLFNFLKLSTDACSRQKYYRRATSRIVQSDDVNIINNRILLIDSGVTLNPTWYDLVLKNNLLEVLSAPLRSNPILTTIEVKQLTNIHNSRLDLTGNSVLLDTIDYNALWTTEFEQAKIDRSPFFNQVGELVGFVDLMRMKKRARLGHIKSVNAKALELPVGQDERFKMVFVIFLETNDVNQKLNILDTSVAFEVFDSFKTSYVPVEVAIPRVVITSEVDVRSMLEELGITSLWNDPVATRNISSPSALPRSYVQRTALTLDNRGLLPPPPPEILGPLDTPVTGLDPKLGNEFIANQPFFFGLFDSESLTCIIAAAFTAPTYRF
ncbi:plasminogen activator inhibitor 2, macrophage-like [Spodoptera litura]|uniref:Plasminogen activator inhibitor 2, macrophage-like n=1 Tax=Spodoptera litura TaxID=69820 RepID=A0A9J7EX32_SPOLT|nr:plasminogen activator inhibitor 2, macrophage-like [Spodoptera litura]